MVNLASEKKNSFTNFAINKICNEILSNIDQSLYTCSVSLDLSKAFDTVNHSILLQKLEKIFRFRGSALSSMESYLTNRYQYTKIGDIKSRKQLIDCSVLQGSSVGSLMFLLYVNDFPRSQNFRQPYLQMISYCHCLMQIYQDRKTESIHICSISLNG